MTTEPERLSALAEAVLFAAGESVGIDRIAYALETDEAAAREALAVLAARLDGSHSAVKLLLLNGRAQLCTRAEFADVIRRALETRRPPSLSASSMETLAIIAYRQPVTRSYVERVRGVDSAYTVSSLAEKGFIDEAGRLEVPGRPILYKTTELFLKTFGLSSLDELPPTELLPEEKPEEEAVT